MEFFPEDYEPGNFDKTNVTPEQRNLSKKMKLLTRKNMEQIPFAMITIWATAIIFMDDNPVTSLFVKIHGMCTMLYVLARISFTIYSLRYHAKLRATSELVALASMMVLNFAGLISSYSFIYPISLAMIIHAVLRFKFAWAILKQNQVAWKAGDKP